MVPEPNCDDDQPYENPVNLWLDNAEQELLTLITSRPHEERQQYQDVSPPVPAERELSRALGCQDCASPTRSCIRDADRVLDDTHPSSRTANIAAEMRTAPFIALGSPMDLSDTLVAKAYQWQIQTDFQNAPVYLSALKHISSQRQSTDLRTEVVMETSRGRFDTESLNEAYRAFHLSGIEGAVSDEDIIGSFAAQVADAPTHEHQLRENLRIVGVHRNSKRIMDTALNSEFTMVVTASETDSCAVIDSYESALAFLDADHSNDDESIQALFAVKVCCCNPHTMSTH